MLAMLQGISITKVHRICLFKLTESRGLPYALGYILKGGSTVASVWLRVLKILAMEAYILNLKVKDMPQCKRALPQH